MTGLAERSAEQKAVIFVHIPKAAGSTLHWIIDRQYAPAEILTVGGLGPEVPLARESFKQLPEAERARLRVLRGFVGCGIHEWLPRPSTYVTLLRDPVARVVSTYYFIRRTPAHTHYSAIASGHMGLEDFVRRGVSRVGVDNGQTRIISGEGASVEFGACSPAMLERAKHHLSHYFSVVGLVERFDESVLLMQKALGWSMPFYVRANVGRGARRKEIPDNTRRLIESHNLLDLELYGYGRGLFEHLLGQQPDSFALRLRVFRLLNALYGVGRKPVGLYRKLVKNTASRHVM